MRKAAVSVHFNTPYLALLQALRLREHCPEYEFIVVDNGSNLGCRRLYCRLCEQGYISQLWVCEPSTGLPYWTANIGGYGGFRHGTALDYAMGRLPDDTMLLVLDSDSLPFLPIDSMEQLLGSGYDLVGMERPGTGGEISPIYVLLSTAACRVIIEEGLSWVPVHYPDKQWPENYWDTGRMLSYRCREAGLKVKALLDVDCGCWHLGQATRLSHLMYDKPTVVSGRENTALGNTVSSLDKAVRLYEAELAAFGMADCVEHLGKQRSRLMTEGTKCTEADAPKEYRSGEFMAWQEYLNVLGSHHLSQNRQEFYQWLLLLQLLQSEIGERLRVLEVGVAHGGQKLLYDAAGFEWVGVDHARNVVDPRMVYGDACSRETVAGVYERFGQRYPHVVFLDANHSYRDTLRAYLTYYPVVNHCGMVAFHDVFTYESLDGPGTVSNVFVLWNDLREIWWAAADTLYGGGANMGIGILYGPTCPVRYSQLVAQLGVRSLTPTPEKLAESRREGSTRVL